MGSVISIMGGRVLVKKNSFKYTINNKSKTEWHTLGLMGLGDLRSLGDLGVSNRRATGNNSSSPFQLILSSNLRK